MMRFVCCVVLLCLIGCDRLLLGDEDLVVSMEENLKPPLLTDDGWDVSQLDAENINAEAVQHLIRSIHQSPRNIHSMLIIRNNKLVSESYFDGWNRDKLHATRSASKSFMSTFVGIAIDKGIIAGVNEKVFDYFPDYADANNPDKSEIEIEHLLTMTAGFDWDEDYAFDDSRNDERRIEKSEDRLGYVLKKKMVSKPGDRFEYNSACPMVEDAIIRKSTGESTENLARKYFFTPLNIKNYYWRKNDDGLITAVGPILLRPRDMAKLGQVFLDKGKWKNQQIVSEEWVRAATTTFIGNEASATGYGYHWWTSKYIVRNVESRMFFAQGSGGQYIYVVPDFNAVVVFTSGNYPPRDQGAPLGMLKNVILPAMQ